MTKRTVSLDEAAEVLGLSKDAVRKRIQRGSLEARKNEAGRWQVLLDEEAWDNVQDKQDKAWDNVQDTTIALLEQLRSENAFLRQELYRKDHIILNLTEGIKLLEAPKQPSLWQRLFGREEK